MFFKKCNCLCVEGKNAFFALKPFATYLQPENECSKKRRKIISPPTFLQRRRLVNFLLGQARKMYCNHYDCTKKLGHFITSVDAKYFLKRSVWQVYHLKIDHFTHK